eukprot:704640-Prymnesium_polylepis.1
MRWHLPPRKLGALDTVSQTAGVSHTRYRHTSTRYASRQVRIQVTDRDRGRPWGRTMYAARCGACSNL